MLSFTVRCVSVRHGEVDNEIDGQLKLVAEFWGVDGIALYELDERERKAGAIYNYAADGNANPPLLVAQ